MKGFFVDLMPGFLVRTFAKPYVSGNSIEKGITRADTLWEEGMSSTLDLLGESVETREMVEYNIRVYHELIEKLSGREEYASVSLKPTSLGIHESYECCEESIRSILEVARTHKIPITIDMEDHPYTDDTLKLYHSLIADFPNLGTVLQSRLFRTDQDIRGLSGIKARIRICIGIYNEPEEIALQNKSEMKEKLIEHTKMLIDGGHYVEVATQDKQTIDSVLALAEEYNWKPDQLEFQQLLGVPMREKQTEILDLGYINRLYVPFATNWKYATPYLKRRLKNNPRMAIYVMKQMVRRITGRH